MEPLLDPCEILRRVDVAGRAEIVARDEHRLERAAAVVRDPVPHRARERDRVTSFAAVAGGDHVPGSCPARRDDPIDRCGREQRPVCEAHDRDPDALALRVGTNILGSGFTGRLMATVRDREGLTYGIHAAVMNDTVSDGDWRIVANFSPELLAQGLASTRRELEAWHRDGVTPEEVEREKSNYVGTFQVSLATTGGMASALLASIQRGYGVAWPDELPQRIAALTTDEINAALRKHVQPDRLVLIKAGTVGSPPTP